MTRSEQVIRIVAAGALDRDARASGEIDELLWIDPEAPLLYPLAQLAREHALPLARRLKAHARSLSE